MAPRTQKLVIETTPRAGRNSYTIANGVTLVEGCLVGLSGGYLIHWVQGATDVFQGILIGGDSRLNDGVIVGNTADTPAPKGFVDNSGVTLKHLTSVTGAAAITDIGDPVESADSDVDSLTTTITVHPIGYISGWRSTSDVDVTLYTPTEMLAQRDV